MARGGGSDRYTRWWRRVVDSPHSLWMLFVASFLETLIVPIPIEAVLAPYMLCRRDRIWLIATVVLAGCLLAALVGYACGYFLFDTVGRWFLDTMGYQARFAAFRERFEAQGFVAILAVGIFPIPFQVGILAAGITGYSLPLFVLAAAIARGLRYFGLGVLVWAFGEPVLRWWRRLPRRATAIALIVVAALYIALRHELG